MCLRYHDLAKQSYHAATSKVSTVSWSLRMLSGSALWRTMLIWCCTIALILLGNCVNNWGSRILLVNAAVATIGEGAPVYPAHLFDRSAQYFFNDILSSCAPRASYFVCDKYNDESSLLPAVAALTKSAVYVYLSYPYPMPHFVLKWLHNLTLWTYCNTYNT